MWGGEPATASWSKSPRRAHRRLPAKPSSRSGFVDSALPQRKTDRAHRLETSVAHESKACGMPVAIQRLADNDLKVSFRPLLSISDVPTIEAD